MSLEAVVAVVRVLLSALVATYLGKCKMRASQCSWSCTRWLAGLAWLGKAGGRRSWGLIGGQAGRPHAECLWVDLAGVAMVVGHADLIREQSGEQAEMAA